MDVYLEVLILAALPVAGNFAGALLAEIFPISKRTLSAALHAAAGCVLAVVGIELMPRALGTDAPWLIVVAFMAGCTFFVLLDNTINIVQIGGGDDRRSTQNRGHDVHALIPEGRLRPVRAGRCLLRVDSPKILVAVTASRRPLLRSMATKQSFPFTKNNSS